MDLGDNLTTNILSLVSLLVAGLTSFFYFRDRRQSKFGILSEYQSGLLDWYSKTNEILILLRCNNLGDERQKVLAQLSAQIELGRFYFPNIVKDNYGKGKPLAYQGYRNLALDFLVYSYNILKRENYNQKIDELQVFQREFTSIIYAIVKPKENLLQIKKLTDKYFVEEKIFEDYLLTKNSEELSNELTNPSSNNGADFKDSDIVHVVIIGILDNQTVIYKSVLNDQIYTGVMRKL